MTSHILICPFDEKLISSIQGRVLVIRLDDLQTIHHANAIVGLHNQLHCILLQTVSPLTSVPFQEDWREIPLALYVSCLGCIKELARKLSLLRQLNVRVYIAEDTKHSYTNLRILSSLGIACGLIFGQAPPDWEALNDLMHYTLYNIVPHAPIEPFQYIASHYRPNNPTDLGSVYFENPLRYLHVDAAGHIALSSKELIAGDFIANNLDQLDNITQCSAYIERLEAWREYFLRSDGCAYCQGWRVCLGKFSNAVDDYTGCKKNFVELMEAAENYQSRQQTTKDIWQP